MAFPQSVLPIKQELLLDGTWTDITSRTRNDASVQITRGTGTETVNLSAGSANWTANNRDFFFSNRSPSSSSYGILGRNTQYRASITESTPWLRLADISISNGAYDGARVSTADKAVLDITGDIDIRVDVFPDNWRGGRAQALIAKYVTTGNQRSWLLWVDRLGYLKFRWSTDGTVGNSVDVQSTDTVEALRRRALRVTLDVNNGSGGSTATFYTSDTISGTWTQLGSTVVTAGVTSIFSSTSDVSVGTIGAVGRSVFAINTQIIDPFVGRINRAQIYSGIGGTLVADMDATAQTPGASSWSDGLGTPNTWTLSASAEITKQDYRFWGELGSIPQEWDISGNDIFGQVQSYDLISRLMQGSKSLHSSVYRNIIRYQSSASGTNGTLDGYWPMENGSQAVRPAPAIGRVGSMTGAIFSVDEDFPGSAGILSFNSDTSTAAGEGKAVSGTSNTGVVTLLFYFRAPSVPGSTVTFMNYYVIGGTSYQVSIGVGAATYRLDITTSDGTSLLGSSVGFGTGAEPDQPMAMRLMLTQNGGNVDYEWGWYPIGAGVIYGVAGSYAGTVGRPRGWFSPAFTGKSGWWLAHVATFREDIGWAGYNFTASTNAYDEEPCEDRFNRLLTEEGIPHFVVGRAYNGTNDPDVAEKLGPQTPQPLMALLQEAVNLDGGMIYSPRDKFGLTFRLRRSLLGRECVELDYSQNVLSAPFKPRDDLFSARNDVTVVNAKGGSGHAVKTSGSMNVNEPSSDPQGIGTYDPGPVTRNASFDSRLQPMAEEEVFFGTWDELRYPNVGVELSRSVFTSNATLTADIGHLDMGLPIRLINLPSQLPPDGVELLVIGYSETLMNRQHPISFNTKPYGPYRALNDLSGSTLFRARAAASNSTISAINTTANTFTITTPDGKLWRVGSSSPTFPMECMIGGEEIAIGQISGATSPQTALSVTRSVNGVALSHDAGTAIQLRDVFYPAR